MVLPVDNPYFKSIALRQASGIGSGGVASTTDLGLPVTFPCVLLSAWVTIPVGYTALDSAIGIQSNGGSAPFNFSINAGLLYCLLNWTEGGQIGNGQLVVSLTPGGIVHVLVSVDSPAHKVQVYVDDAPHVIPMGYFNANPMGNFGYTWQFSAFYTGSGEQICAGDVWFNSQASFTDLTVVANRRKFINADLTPANLGSNGQTPFGTAPAVFLHAPLVGSASDFLVNYGTGGPWFRVGGGGVGAGYCIPPDEPPPVETERLAMDDVMVTVEADLSANLISLRWSDDGGHS